MRGQGQILLSQLYLRLYFSRGFGIETMRIRMKSQKKGAFTAAVPIAPSETEERMFQGPMRCDPNVASDEVLDFLRRIAASSPGVHIEPTGILERDPSDPERVIRRFPDGRLEIGRLRGTTFEVND